MLIDLNFEDEEEVQSPQAKGAIGLEFEGEGEGEGVTGEMRPTDRNPFEWIRDSYMEGYSQTRKNIAQQKGLIFDETKEDTARTGARIKELERTAEGYGPELDTMQQLYEISEADSITDAVGLMIKYPEATAQVTLSSLGRFAPALAVTAGVSTVTGGATIPLMGSTFMGSLSVEYGAVMDETISESGYDSTDPRAWQKAVSDQDMLDRAKERGVKRGIPIAVFDAISMGLAGKILAGAKPTATSILTRSTGELAQQSVAGGLGEAAAQVVETGGIEKPGEIALEGFAEIGPGMVETLIGYKGAKQQALRKLMAEQAGYEAAQNVADAAITPDFEIHTLEENETAIEQALAATPPTPEIRPDEESATERFDLEEQPVEQEPLLDLEQQQAEDEANTFVLEQLRAQFPEASEAELQAAITTARPKPEELPTEEDLGWVPTDQIKPETVATTEVRAKPKQPREELPGTETDIEMDLELDEAALDEITRDEVVAATENVESTGDAIKTAETIRTARPEFEGTIFSFKPGDERNGEPMEHYYGEIAETEDADGDPIDVMWNKDADPQATEGPIFIINQIDPDTQEFRQHKVLGGFDEMAEAETAYMNQWGEESLQNTSELTAAEFKTWIQEGDHKIALAEDDFVDDDGRSWGPQGPAEGMEIQPDEPNPRDLIRARKDQAEADRRKRGAEQARQNRVVEETDDLVTFIRKKGGLNVDMQSDIPGHRLAVLGQDRSIGMPNLVQKGDNGLSLADLTELAWGSGYITENDTTQLINKLFEAESKPVYNAAGYEAATQREIDELANEKLADEADNWADYINESAEFSQVDPETARLMALAGAIDHDKMVDIASRDAPEADVQAALQAYIDERESTKAETKSAEKPAPETRPADEKEPAAAEGQTRRDRLRAVADRYEAIGERLVEAEKSDAFYKMNAARIRKQADLASPEAGEDLDAIEKIVAKQELNLEIKLGGRREPAEFTPVTLDQMLEVYNEVKELPDDIGDVTDTLINKINANRKKIAEAGYSMEGESRPDPTDPEPHQLASEIGVLMARLIRVSRAQVPIVKRHKRASPGKLQFEIHSLRKDLGMPYENIAYTRVVDTKDKRDLKKVAKEGDMLAEDTDQRAEAAGTKTQTYMVDKGDTGLQENLSEADILAQGGVIVSEESVTAEEQTDLESLPAGAVIRNSSVPDSDGNQYWVARSEVGPPIGPKSPTEQGAVDAYLAQEEQTDFVGKTDEQKAQQAILDAKIEKEEQIPTERPAEAQSDDDLFAAGGQLPPDLFDQPEAKPETKGEQSNNLVENITASDYPVGTKYFWSGFGVKVTGIKTREETGGRPKVLLEYTEGPHKGKTTTAPGHLKNLQADLVPPFDIETTMGTVRLDVQWTMALDRYHEIYEEKTVGMLSIQMHGPDDRDGSMRYRSIAGMPVRAETPEQLLDPEWIKDVAITAADSVLRRGEYFGEHVNMGKYKGGKARVVGRPITSMTEVLELSRDPTPDAKDLNKIKITVKTDDVTVSHMAKWWIDALDKRLEAVAELRTCA